MFKVWYEWGFSLRHKKPLDFQISFSLGHFKKKQERAYSSIQSRLLGD